jgi:hypothetical protein
MMKTLFVFLLMTLVVLTAAAADVTGKWSGSFITTAPDGNIRESTALLDLKQSGTDITGSVGPNEEERYPIGKGRIDGNKITLEVQNENRSMKFELTLAGERMQGEANMTADSETRKAKLDLKRVK